MLDGPPHIPGLAEATAWRLHAHVSHHVGAPMLPLERDHHMWHLNDMTWVGFTAADKLHAVKWAVLALSLDYSASFHALLCGQCSEGNHQCLT